MDLHPRPDTPGIPFETIAENSYDWENWIDATGRLAWISASVERISGYTREECFAMEDFPLAIIHADDRNAFASMWEGACRGSSGNDEELRIRRKDGDIRWCSISWQPVRDANGNMLGHRSSIRDISRRKGLQARLAQSEERFRSIYENSDDAMLLTAPDGRILAANPAACRMFGRGEADICQIGRSGLLDNDNPSLAEALEVRKRTGHFSGRLKYVRSDGSTFAGELTTTVFRDANGEERTSMIVRDVSARESMEQAMTAAAAFNAAILDSLRFNIAVIDTQGAIVLTNSAWNRFAAENGMPESKREFVGLDYFAVCRAAMAQGDEVARRVLDALRDLQRGASDYFTIEYPCHSPDEKRWFQLHATKLRDDRGRIVVAHENVTIRHQTELALRESEMKFRTLTLNLPDIIARFDLELRHIYVSPLIKNITGIPAEDYLGKSNRDLGMHAETVAFWEKELRKTIETRRQRTLEFEFLAVDGVHKFQSLLVPELDENGEPVSVLSVSRDVTERDKMLAALRRSQNELRELNVHLLSAREEERKNISREIHDELGQIFTALKMDLRWIEKRSEISTHEPLLEKVKSMIDLTSLTIEKVHRITAELRPGMLDDLGLAATIEWLGRDFMKRYGVQCSIILDFPERCIQGGSAVSIFRVIQEALTNVVRHAQASMVSIELREQQGRLELLIRDNGAGIRDEQANGPRSFGLIGMRERIQGLGGTLSIRSDPGRGTQIHAVIPCEANERHP